MHDETLCIRRGPGALLGLATALIVVGLTQVACGSDSPPSGLPSPPPPPPPGNAAYRIEYSTLFGGTGFEEIREPVLLSGGRLLFGARTLSANAPVRPGAYQSSHGGGQGDAYLGIMSSDGTQLEAGTFFGGSGMERPPYGIAVTSNGDVVFTTGTTSPNIPTSASSYRRNLHSPVPTPGGGFVCRISGNLSTLRWCSYTDGGWPRGGLRLDNQDNVIVTGGHVAQNFQMTPGAFQGSGTSTFTLKLNPAGTAAIFAARFGGGFSVRIRPSGELSLIGISNIAGFPTTSGAAQTTSRGLPDAYAALMRADGTGLVYSTFLSGSGVELAEHPHVLLPDGSILFSGVTRSGDLPSAIGTPPGQEDSFLAKLNPSGSAYEYVRYLGGPGDDSLLGPVLDVQGNIYMYGNTSSRNMATGDALQASYQGGTRDGLLLVLSPDGSQIRFATYLGGDGDDLIRGVVIGSAGEIYVVGRTASSNFPTTPGAFQRQPGGDDDGFVVKLVPVNN